MQIYKIQALSCLMMAYCMSVLYLDGIKLGDQQVQEYLRPSTKVLASQ
jgi:hypothetical protein